MVTCIYIYIYIYIYIIIMCVCMYVCSYVCIIIMIIDVHVYVCKQSSTFNIYVKVIANIVIMYVVTSCMAIGMHI